MSEEATTTRDAERRAALKVQLQERMRLSIVEQGSYGVIQTQRWLKAYKRAKLMTSQRLADRQGAAAVHVHVRACDELETATR